MISTRIITEIDVIGHIWQPGVGLCAMTYPAREEDLRGDDGRVTRETISAWLDTHAGAFSKVVDFRATVGANVFDCDFASEENELIYNDCVFGDEGIA